VPFQVPFLPAGHLHPDQSIRRRGWPRCAADPNPYGVLRVQYVRHRPPVLSPQGGTLSFVPTTPQEVNGRSVVFHSRQTFARVPGVAVHTGPVANGKTQITSGLALAPQSSARALLAQSALMQSHHPDAGLRETSP